MVHASPKLGGDVEVAYIFPKKIPHGIQSDEDEEPAAEERMAQQNEACWPKEANINHWKPIPKVFLRSKRVLNIREKQE